MKKIFILITLLFIGCSSVEVKEKVSSHEAEKIVVAKDFKLHLKDGESDIMDTYDPLEPLNRRIYYFNYQFDNWVWLPISNSYNFFLPQTIRTGINNFFSNLYEPISAINGVLLLDSKTVFTGISRFIINTTIGVAGLFDVATLINIPKRELTLNDTLAVYGVKDGPYLILPFLGPSDLRNAGSRLTTFALNPIHSGSLETDLVIKGVEGVDTRSRTDFRYYSLGTPFEYEVVRLLYLKSMEIRETNIKKI
ncbi:MULTISPECIES: MlaA family lipoprotein [Psychrilyobacter]|uniref:VacJ family lipoprotein n=2 Tax=Psychrilyobacter TaxID=623282 RepID=A0ABX9KF47_9FUSO|nr:MULTISPECIES: VacJ family lipoprotein [Psychrilyobacter]NDI78588.1 VacJ family lipoprotein [Psychrilyobacter piezotolerans]RDE60291.1 VacJ family lipoprotein [Psychrilyobacter sp. S5]REI40399.1 VacJ family lipoprotein [Psychrilyobacter piezotolerans]